MKRLFQFAAASLLLLAFSAPIARADSVVVTACGSESLTAGKVVIESQDQTGAKCVDHTAGGATAARQDTGNTSLGNIDSDQGGPADPACGTDAGTCSELALLKRAIQRLTTLITNLGSPMQAGGALGAGQANIGNVGGKTVVICTTPTVTASNSYGTNYVVGGKLTFAGAFTSTGTGILQGVVVTIKKVETSGFTFVPFNSDPSNSTWTDAAVAAINAADVAAVREPVSLAAYSGLGTHTAAYADGIGEPLAPGATTLYGLLIANAALTNQFGSTSDVQVCVKILQDV